MTASADDWRWTGKQSYLQGLSFEFGPYHRYSRTWDHDHCELCFAKFSEDAAESLHHGFHAEHEGRWVCDVCFDDFRERFAWTVTQHPVDRMEVLRKAHQLGLSMGQLAHVHARRRGAQAALAGDADARAFWDAVYAALRPR